MTVKDAVQTAIANVQDLYESEGITNLGLEEVAFDAPSEEWIVTVGFSRPWDYPNSRTSAIAAALATQASQAQAKRSFKIVRVRDSDGQIMSIKNYATGEI